MARRLATLRSFLNFLSAQASHPDESGENRGFPASGKEIAGILDDRYRGKPGRSSGDRDQLGKRDRAILELLYATGLRVSELVGIDVGDIDLGEGLVRVLGKGRKERLVPFGDKAQ